MEARALTEHLGFVVLDDDPSYAFNLQVCVPLPPWAVRAGARRKIYFDPSKVNAAIVTCGGKNITCWNHQSIFLLTADIAASPSCSITLRL